MMIELKKKIEKASVISFDIFDTLIIRSYNKPTDLFKHIDLSVCKGFEKARIEAEQKARLNASDEHREEVTLDEIYDLIPKNMQEIKNIELEQELICCSKDANMFEMFNYAKSLNKRIVLTSDMYLPLAFVEKLLKNCGYEGYEKLFLSSNEQVTKVSGNLFNKVLSYLNVTPDKLLHIGDNLLTDHDIPSSMGINVFFYQKAAEIDFAQKDYKFYKMLINYENRLPISIMKGLFVKYSQNTHKPLEGFAYQYAGLMTVGFCQWLKSRLDINQINKIFFMARDGFIPQKVFNTLYPQYNTNYMLASRRCYLLSGMNRLDDILLYLVNLGTDGLTYEQYWKALSINNKKLYSLYCQMFPKQQNIINKNELKIFFEKKDVFKELEKEKEKEKEIVLAYFKKMKLLNEKCALIDIGWRASVQKSIERTIANECDNIYKYYLATHPLKKGSSKIDSYLLNENFPTEHANIINPILPILELIYTAPEAGTIKLTQDKNGKIKPEKNILSSNEQNRILASSQIAKGIMDFTQDWLKITKNLPINISAFDTLIPFINFNHNLRELYYDNLKSLNYSVQIGNATKEHNLLSTYNPEKTIGVVYTWPGSESAEKEVVLRLRKATHNIGYNLVLFERNGYILDEETLCTPNRIRDHDFKFVITLHYEDMKIFDCFHYHVLWNPPEIPLALPYYREKIDNYLSNDDFLIYDDGGMKNHLMSMLIDNQRDLDKASSLVASFPKSEIKKPNLDNIKLFYCGMNWDCLNNASHIGRHSGLFHLLDDNNLVEIYGPEAPKAWGGVRPWAGYKNYRGEIPFDGFSILDIINNCGVVLACSSDVHRRAGAVTNRVYEACTAGAVIISDDNPFMKKHFGNSVLYIDFNKDNPLDTYRQIKEKLDWIKNHKKEALALAKASQDIFIQKFCMEVQLQNVINNHENRKKAVARAMYARRREDTVLAVSYVDTPILTAKDIYRIKQLFYQIKNQNYEKIVLGLAVENAVVQKVKELIPSDMKNVIIIPLEIFNKKRSKLITRGEMLRIVLNKIPHNYFSVLNGCEILFKEHYEVLKRKLEDNTEAVAAYSGLFSDEVDRRDIWEKFVLTNVQLFNLVISPTGRCLMKSEIENYVPDYVDRNVDGWEIHSFLNRALFHFEKKIIYSERITCGYNPDLDRDFITPCIGFDLQKRFIQGLVHFDYENWVANHTYAANIFHNHDNCTPSIDEHLLKLLKKIQKRKNRRKILLLRLKSLFVWSHAQRTQIKKKIKSLKKEYKENGK